MKKKGSPRSSPSAKDDIDSVLSTAAANWQNSSNYRLAYDDPELLVADELRGVRLMLEYLKPELRLQEADIHSTVVVFGSARIGEHLAGVGGTAADELQPYYTEARRFAEQLSTYSKDQQPLQCVVMTGGGPGIMEAANRGAHDAGAKSIGLNIVLPHEQCPNEFSTPELTFQFHYFALRKLHFMLRAQALVAFPGGFGTLDELFDALTLLQTRRIKSMPILLVGKKFWQRIINFEALAELGLIAESDLHLFTFVERAEEAVEIIKAHVEASPPEAAA